MREFEHMKTSLYLTDVLLLGNEGDIVNFLCLEITKTSRGFEVKNNTDLVESIVVTFTPTFAKPSENSSFHGTLETRHAIRHPTLVHASPHSQNREQARSETVDAISQRHAQYLPSPRTTHNVSIRND